MNKRKAGFWGVVLVALGVVSVGCAGSSGNSQTPRESPSAGPTTLEVVTANPSGDSQTIVAPKLETNGTGETAAPPLSQASRAIQQPASSSTGDAIDKNAVDTQTVVNESDLPLQSTKAVEVDPGKLRQLLFQDAIPPIYHPEFISAKDAGLDPEELLIGVEIDGDVRAYPIGPLVRREMVNDVVGGVPILVTW